MPIVWVDFLHISEPRKNVTQIKISVLIRSFKIIQHHRNCYQSKAHIRLPIIIPLYANLLSCPRDITIYLQKKAFFRRFLPIPISFKPLQGVPRGTLGVKVGIKTTRMPGIRDGENCVILRLLVLSQYQSVTDRQTVTPPIAKSRYVKLTQCAPEHKFRPCCTYHIPIDSCLAYKFTTCFRWQELRPFTYSLANDTLRSNELITTNSIRYSTNTVSQTDTVNVYELVRILFDYQAIPTSFILILVV